MAQLVRIALDPSHCPLMEVMALSASCNLPQKTLYSASCCDHNSEEVKHYHYSAIYIYRTIINISHIISINYNHNWHDD